MINKINIKASAKINLGLRILSKREDGFHNLHTLFYPIHDLYDELVLEKSDTFVFKSNLSVTKNSDDNLIVKAKNLLERVSGKKINVKIELKKNIPVGAGLGGGSSDAAAVMLSLNDMFGLKLSFRELTDLSLKLGSDVPFFIKSIPAIGRSRGEILEFVKLSIDKNILIVNPGIHISTKDAFSKINPVNKELDYKIVDGKIYDLKNLKNDFEESVFETYPEIAEIKNSLYENGADFSMMSGTGSTVYGIFTSYEEAVKAKSRFPSKYFTFLSTRET